MKRYRDAPSEGISHFLNNRRTSPHRSSVKVSHPNPETKKYHDFQSRKEVGKLQTILDSLFQGKHSKYPSWVKGFKRYKLRNSFRVIVSPSWTDTHIDIHPIIVLHALGTSWPVVMSRTEKSCMIKGCTGKRRPHG